MPRYLDAENGLLSVAARSLEEPGLTAHADLAEDLLGLSAGSVVTEAAVVAKAQRAVALQINHQVAQSPNWSVLASNTQGSRTETYRNWEVNPSAKRLADEVLADPSGTVGASERWGTTTSLRTRG